MKAPHARVYTAVCQLEPFFLLHRQMVGIMLIGFMLIVFLSSCGGANSADTSEGSDQPVATATSATVAEEESATEEAAPTAATTEDSVTGSEETDESSEAASADEETNEGGGFAFVPVDGWEVVTNEGLGGFGGAVALVPDGEDLDNADAFIFLTASPAEFFLEGSEDSELGGDVLDQMLSSLLTDADDVTVAEPEDITIGGIDGRVVDLSGEDPDLGEMRGRVAVAQVDDERLFQMMAVASAEEWMPDTFDTILTSLRFFEPTEADLDEMLEAVPTLEALTEELEGVGTEMEEPTGSDDDAAEEDVTDAVEEPAGSDDAADRFDTVFPLPSSAEGVTLTGAAQDQVNYQTALDLTEVMDFYRDELTPDGATERTLLTTTTDSTFSMVFDGWPEANGLAVVVQGVVLSPGQTNVNIRFEDV